jgi:hypothetical protein
VKNSSIDGRNIKLNPDQHQQPTISRQASAGYNVLRASTEHAGTGNNSNSLLIKKQQQSSSSGMKQQME